MFKISFAIPAFNVENFLEEAVESVIGQRLSSFEIVIVNDGSIDKTAKVCKNLIKKYKYVPITYFEHQKNLGPCEAHNSCFKLSKGEYIYNLDADNILSKGLIVKLLKVAEKKFKESGKYIMVSPEFAQFFSDKNFSSFGIELPFKHRVMLYKLYFDKLDYNHIMTRPRTPATGGNYLYHRTIFEKTGGYLPDGGCFDNWGFGIACYVTGFRYITVPGTFYLHRVHRDSNWMRFARKGLEKKYLFKMLSHFREYYSDETLKKLNPKNPNYPQNPIEFIKLRENKINEKL